MNCVFFLMKSVFKKNDLDGWIVIQFFFLLLSLKCTTCGTNKGFPILKEKQF